MTDNKRYDAAKEAVMRVYSDLSVTPDTTKYLLECLMDEIQIMIEVLDSDR